MTAKRIAALLPALLLSLALAAACAPATGTPGATAAPSGSAASAVALLPETTATPTPAPQPTAAPDPLRPPEGAYTIAWLSDTQHYSRKYPLIYLDQTAFLKQEAGRLNLAYVVHTGDLVHNREDEAQWAVADEAMRTLDGIPYGVCAGNHDVGTQADDCDYTYFSRYFGEARMAGRPWYGGSYADNRGHFDLIDAGGTRYVFVYLGYHVDRDGLDFVNETLAAYPDRVGVLCVHSYFDHDCTLTDQGELLYDAVVAKNPNLYLVLCGHRYNSACVPATFDDDGDGTAERTVLQMICNYQAAGHTGKYGYSGVGAVVGATYPDQLTELRKALPHTFFLVPGYGAQGGGAEGVAGAFDENGLGAIINSSRGILCAWQKTGAAPEDYAKAAREEALRMKADLCRVIPSMKAPAEAE